MSRCLKTLSIKRPSSSRGVNFQVLISGHFLHLSPASSNILRAGWRVVGGRAPLRLIWENSQHPQMPCVISTRNGWILGEKNSEKCSLCLIMFRSNWTEILWNVLIWPAPRLFGANKRNNCQCSRTAKTSGDPRIWRFIGGLAFLSAAPLGRKLRTENASLLQKPPMASSKLGRRGKSAGFSPLTFHPLECGGEERGGRLDCMEKGRILGRKLWNLKAVFHSGGWWWRRWRIWDENYKSHGLNFSLFNQSLRSIYIEVSSSYTWLQGISDIKTNKDLPKSPLIMMMMMCTLLISSITTNVIITITIIIIVIIIAAKDLAPSAWGQGGRLAVLARKWVRQRKESGHWTISKTLAISWRRGDYDERGLQNDFDTPTRYIWYSFAWFDDSSLFSSDFLT